MTIGQLIKQSRKEKGITQNELAKRIGVSAGAISRWESGDIENMRRDRIEKLADALGIDPNIIIGIEPNKEMDGNIPILGRVAAGIPIDAVEEIIGYEEIPKRLLAYASYFALKIRGESMQPNIQDSDIVIVRKQESASDGDIVIAQVNHDEEATCKRLKMYRDQIMLLSDNPAYSPQVYDANDVHIVGVVTEVRRKLIGS
jgi:repressor LexA